MKTAILLTDLVWVSAIAEADSFPVITTQPQNQTVTLGGNASFSVAAPGATGTATFSKSLAPEGIRFYRAAFLP